MRLDWLMGQVAIPGWWLGLAHERIRPGPAVWAVLISLLIMIPNSRSLGPFSPGPYWVYIATGDWLAQNTREPERVLDLTDWSLYFSQRPGYNVANVADAMSDPNTRWIVVREPSNRGRLALRPDHPRTDRWPRAGRAAADRDRPDQAPIRIYDRYPPACRRRRRTTGSNNGIWRR